MCCTTYPFEHFLSYLYFISQSFCLFFFFPSPIIHQSFSQKQGRSPGTKAVFLNKSIAESKISGGTNSSWCKSAEASSQVRGPVPCYTTCSPKSPAHCPHQKHSWEVAKAAWGYEPREKWNRRQQNKATATPLTRLLLARDFRIKLLGEKLTWKTSTLPKASFPAQLSSNTFQGCFFGFFLTNYLGVTFHKREKKKDN